MLTQATGLYPKRSKASDGVCPGPSHPPTGDHPKGEAVDLTHDPAHGCDVDALFARIVERRDPRVKYLIRARRICRSYDKPGIPAWTWAPYTGDNPHDKHGHCSILPGARDDTSPWFSTPNPQPEPDPEEDMLRIVQCRDHPAAGEFLTNGIDSVRTLTPAALIHGRNLGYYPAQTDQVPHDWIVWVDQVQDNHHNPGDV